MQALTQPEDAADYSTAQIQRHVSRFIQEMGQIDSETKYSDSVPNILKDMEKSNCSTKYQINPAANQRQKSHTLDIRRPNQQEFVSQYKKTNAGLDSSTSNAERNKSMKCTRETASTSRTAPAARPRTNHRPLQRKIHSGHVAKAESETKRMQTYSVKKPLPLSYCMRPTCLTHMSDSQSSLSCYYVDNDNHRITPHRVLPGTLNKTGSKAKSAVFPRTPTPKPSVRQLNDIRAGISLRNDHRQQQIPTVDDDQSQQPYVNLQPYNNTEDTQTDGQAALETTDGAHLSSNEHSLRGKYDNHYYTTEQREQQLLSDPVSTTANCQTRHVGLHITRKPADNNDGKHQQDRQQQVEQHQQQAAAEPLPASPSHESVTSAAAPSRTLGMQAVMRPVPVAPSGAAGHHRLSRIPRPKLASAHRSVSATSTISKYSSLTSLRDQLNYARPMPTERIPFSKFGVEYIVPVARHEVSVTAVEAFSITGMSGQRKRFLPLTESIAEDLWEKVQNRLNPLLVVTTQYDAGQNLCTVSVISSTVARPVSHAATQTRKSVSLKQRKNTRLLRKEKAGKQDENNDDYSGMLVRLVQLLYLQTKLNASNNADKSKASNTEATGNSPHASPLSASWNSTLKDYLQKLQQQRQAAPSYAQNARPTQILLHTRPQSSLPHSARVYRAGSSVTQVYSKNYSSVPVGSGNNWENPVNSASVYVDQVHSDMTPWKSPTTTAFMPRFSQHYHNYDN